MSGCFEVRVVGRLSDRVRAAFPGLAVVEVPAETLISGCSGDELYDVLSRIQDLGLRLVSLRRVGECPEPSGDV